MTDYSVFTLLTARYIDSGMDLKAARQMAGEEILRNVAPAYAEDDGEAQDSYDRLKQEHGLDDAGMNDWQNRSRVS
jgi:hypothetical protein